MKTRIQMKVKTRNEMKAFLSRMVTGCNLDHIGVAQGMARVHGPQYGSVGHGEVAWTMARQ